MKQDVLIEDLTRHLMGAASMIGHLSADAQTFLRGGNELTNNRASRLRSVINRAAGCALLVNEELTLAAAALERMRITTPELGAVAKLAALGTLNNRQIALRLQVSAEAVRQRLQELAARRGYRVELAAQLKRIYERRRSPLHSKAGGK